MQCKECKCESNGCIFYCDTNAVLRSLCQPCKDQQDARANRFVSVDQWLNWLAANEPEKAQRRRNWLAQSAVLVAA